MTVSRYHPLLVALHWTLAALILATLWIGFFQLGGMANENPAKIGLLRLHMAGGMLILALTLARLVVRLRTARPPPLPTGVRLFDRLAPISHWGLYVLVIAMAATGYATALLAGLPAIVFQGSGDPLPSFFAYPSFIAHFVLAFALVGLIGLHLSAALYHRLLRRDRIFRRMWFGPRAEKQTAPEVSPRGRR